MRLGVKQIEVRDFSDSPLVNIALPMQGARVQSLVEELGSCVPHGVTKKKKKKKKKRERNGNELVDFDLEQ